MDDQKKDKFKATWLSHSSIADFLKCPRLYYLRNIYKNPRAGHKITVLLPHPAGDIASHTQNFSKFDPTNFPKVYNRPIISL